MGGKNSKHGAEQEQREQQQQQQTDICSESSNSSKMIKSIAVLIAMTEEAEPLIKKMELSSPVPVGSPMGCMRYAGTRNGADVNVVVFGKDKVYNTGACLVVAVLMSLVLFVAVARFAVWSCRRYQYVQ